MKQILFSILVVMMYSSCCPWCGEDCEKHYNFETQYTLEPAKETYNLGDTIWISCDIPTTLIADSGESVDFTEEGLLTEFYIGKLDTFPYIHNYEDFDYIETIGDLSYFALVGVSGFRLNHEIINKSFMINFGIIPNKKGLYVLGFSSVYSAYNGEEPEINELENCNEFVDILSINLNSRENNNYELLLNSTDEAWRSLSKEGFDREGGYCFYVVD